MDEHKSEENRLMQKRLVCRFWVFGNTRGEQHVVRGAWCMTRGQYAIRNTQYHATPRNPKNPHSLSFLLCVHRVLRGESLQ